VNQLFLDIKAKLLLVNPGLKFIQMYNGQFNDIEIEDGAAVYSIPVPFVLVEFADDIEWKQLGGGAQIADPLDITLHYGNTLFDAQDGTQEQNLAIYTEAGVLFKGMNKFEPNGCVQWIRFGHTQDKQHKALYHFQQKYRTNYVDTLRIEPVDGITKNPPTDLEINASYEEPPYTKGL